MPSVKNMISWDNADLAIVDVETTGGQAQVHRIIEIGVVRLSKGKVSRSFHSLVNPLIPIPPMITSITGIKDEDVVDAPVFSEIKDKLWDVLSGAMFVAHNARFDYGFIQKEFERHGMDFKAKTICTVVLSRNLYPQFKQHNLSVLIDRFAIDCAHRHRALDDAKVVYEFLKKSEKQVGALKFFSGIQLQLKRQEPKKPKRIVKASEDQSPALQLIS